MTAHRRSLLPALLLAAVLVVGGCQGGAAADAARPAGAPSHHLPGDTPARPRVEVDGVRTVVEHDLGGAVMVIELVEVGAVRAATMVVRTDDPAGPVEQIRVIEEIVVGNDHFVRPRDAEVVFGADLWIHIDLDDPRQRAFLDAEGPGLLARAEAARAGDAPGVRVARERVRRPPIEPPSGRVVSLPDLDEVVDGRRPR